LGVHVEDDFRYRFDISYSENHAGTCGAFGKKGAEEGAD
jgi:hypothetical protein